MYSFSIENEYNKAFAVIEYAEENSLNSLYEKEIPFIKNLLERYYDDFVFSIEELQMARKDLMKYMDLDNWKSPLDKHSKEQINFIYKLIAIISYAIQNESALYGSGD